DKIDLNLKQIGVIRKKQIFCWELKSEKFDVKLCRDELIRRFNDIVRRRITRAVSTNQRYFEGWVDRLIIILEQKLCELNPELKSHTHKIKEIEDDIELKKVYEEILDESKDYIDGLLNMQGGVDNG